MVLLNKGRIFPQKSVFSLQQVVKLSRLSSATSVVVLTEISPQLFHVELNS